MIQDELTRLKELAEKAKAADEQLRGPYTLGSKLFAELTATTMELRQAANPTIILSLIERVEKAEEALKPHACSCPGDCERDGDSAYASRDMCCIAHDALKRNPATGE